MVINWYDKDDGEDDDGWRDKKKCDVDIGSFNIVRIFFCLITG